MLLYEVTTLYYYGRVTKCVHVLVILVLVTSFPGADDTTLFTKFQRQHKGHSHYQSPQKKLDDPEFTIVHYAGPVVYHIHVSDIVY